MRKKQLITEKPAYYNGQLLLADDFIGEQRYHVHAARRHSLNLHGWGVVRGLEVSCVDGGTIAVSPGYAVDGRGREIEVREAERLELHGVQGRSTLSVSLGYQAEQPGDGANQARTLSCYAVLRVASGVEEHDVPLATVTLDDKARVTPDGIDHSGRRLLQAEHKGWLRMPFRPTRIPEDQKDTLPPFRVGATQAVAHRQINGQENKQGAGGTMAIVLPPQVTGIHRLRVAGAANDRHVSIVLFKAMWDARQLALTKTEVVKEVVEGKVGAGAFDRTWPIAAENVDVDPVCSTLSLSIRTEAYAAISLVALEVSY
jgi:hypothetical protein